MPYSTGLLVLTSPVRIVCHRLNRILHNVSGNIHKTLYVYLEPALYKVQPNDLGRFQPSALTSLQDTRTFANNLYRLSSTILPSVDVKLLLHNSSQNHRRRPISLKKSCDLIFTDYPERQSEAFNRYIHSKFLDLSVKCTYYPDDVLTGVQCSDYSHVTDAGSETDRIDAIKQYDHVVLGGTFDRIHNGHKVLLNESCLLTRDSVTIGVTNQDMIQRKVLPELILPCQERILNLLDYLREIQPALEYKLEPISDPYGPSIVDPGLQCIVVSEETRKGGELVNEKRKERGLSTLEIHVIELMEDKRRFSGEEDKISSSSYRRRLLGTLLNIPKPKPELGNKPYVIGLTGNIASGKSSVCKRLKDLGAVIVDCDKLGHSSYVKGTNAYDRIIKTFADVLDSNQEIDRKKLGAKVFSSNEALEKLNKIVWPAIADLAKKEIHACSTQGKHVVILDAAILLRAGWDGMVHEVWGCVIPKQEAVKRIMDRNNLSDDQALQRIDSQMSNYEVAERSHVVLSTLWEYDVTQRQVEKAWSLLQERLHTSHL